VVVVVVGASEVVVIAGREIGQGAGAHRHMPVTPTTRRRSLVPLGPQGSPETCQ
jgi:hypothetical protein